MQHHGTPTRLLDWSENVLVALYFAVEQSEKDDGELWALQPSELWSQYGFSRGVPLMAHPVLNFLALEPQLSDAGCEDSLRKLKRNFPKFPTENDFPKLFPAPIHPTLRFPRMVAQMSTFTIHPPAYRAAPPFVGDSIENCLTNKKKLVRYIVPHPFKKKLKENLAALGIQRRTLFPDLDGLSLSIVEEHNQGGDTKPAPPNWGQKPSDVIDTLAPPTPKKVVADSGREKNKTPQK